MKLSAQISVYPLAQEDFLPGVDAAIAALQASGLQVRVGPMSTLITGDEEAVFAALRRAFKAAAAHGATIMVGTVSNACDVPPGACAQE